MMSKPQTQILSSYTPTGYFMSPAEWVTPEYQASADNGEVVVRLNKCNDPIDQNLLARVDDDVKGRFGIWQMLTNRVFTLESPRVQQIAADGTIKTILYAGVVSSRGRVTCEVWPTITYPDGTVVDTREEFIQKNTSLAKKIETLYNSDSILRPLVESYTSAFRDESNSLIHLYEVRDKLNASFKGDKQAKLALGLGLHDKSWNRFGDICNQLPIRQGRHRGKHLFELRDITDEELGFVLTFARELIVRYVDHVTAKLMSNS